MPSMAACAAGSMAADSAANLAGSVCCTVRIVSAQHSTACDGVGCRVGRAADGRTG